MPDRVREALRARGLDWPAPIEHHARLGSTSDRLKEKAREGAPEWAAVLADEQTGGRGRQGRSWASPPGGLYLSVLLRPRFAPVSLIPLAAGVAVVEALRERGARAELKWPNDVLAADRKLAGILAEASSSSSGLDWIVLGLGVNLFAPPEALPEDLRATATSVLALTGRRLEPAEAAAAVLARLTVWYDALRAEPPSVLRAWRACAVPWWGRRVELRSGGSVIRGVAEDVDPAGALLLTLEDGSRKTVVSGDATGVRLEAEGTDRVGGR